MRQRNDKGLIVRSWRRRFNKIEEEEKNTKLFREKTGSLTHDLRRHLEH